MKTYHKTQPKIKEMKISHPAPVNRLAGSRSKIATLAATIFFKIAASFAPLNKFQMALYYTGKEYYSKNKQKSPSLFAAWYKKNQISFAILERLLFIGFVLFSLFTNPYLLLILPALGAVVFYRNRVKWLWWKIKVFLLFRNYYEHRRNLYKMGVLAHHFKRKAPKIYQVNYGSAIIWGESETIQNIKYRSLQKSHTLTAKEYISL